MTCDNYAPDLMAMGDCKNCGHTYESHLGAGKRTFNCQYPGCRNATIGRNPTCSAHHPHVIKENASGLIRWMIVHRPTGGFLPESCGGYTRTEPTCDPLEVPRLFPTEVAARKALTWWLKGKHRLHCEVWSGHDTLGGLNEVVYSGPSKPEPVESRKAEDMAVVPMRLKEVKT
jgi:hypothetical protein